MPLAATLGLGSVSCACVTALVLNQHGNAITLSADLWKRGVRDGKSLREEIIRSRREKIFTFGVVFPFSSHRHLLRKWLFAQGIDPERDVRFVVVPPPQMVANLKAGHLDGFCVGEPWNSLAVSGRAGWIAATSAELDPGHPEKVLMVRQVCAEQRAPEHLALVAALRAAGEFCAQPENRACVAATLARPEYVGVPEDILKRGLAGQLDCGNGVTRRLDDFFVFHGDGVNEPSGRQAAWALQLVRDSGLCPEPASLNFPLSRSVYRQDLFAASGRAASTLNQPSIHEKKPELLAV
jgi:ABC-type nitrate/sulfonate/bicarbonate transport system substrate-binding protein